MWEKFGDSEWNIPQARSTVAQLRHHAGDGREYDGIELFLALCEYLDLLHGKHGFDYFYTGAEQAALAAAVQEMRGPEVEPDPRSERLVQPVNAAVTLVEGRDLVIWLEGQPDWQRQIGLCLRAMYAYLDQLYGGPGAFNQLLKPAELERVAAR
ncbi:hypothetical protein EV649_5219 [Kribbella sp. VKM Ac-2569]|uniref:hypothetical protein n=1 Tax=Kribbella sp. VKM Ac-2569 TaxID=2512220 RepID=UPI00102AD920|nr:hypothetical protein [Kribbella sp. VKM Ac-2569]RZT17662.1 hypothetical protein EV649_5219 [Kribbella sp. VKM Ac-2569]